MSYGRDLEDLGPGQIAGVIATLTGSAFICVCGTRNWNAFRPLAVILGIATSISLYILSISTAVAMIGGVDAMATVFLIAPLLAVATLTAWVTCLSGAFRLHRDRALVRWWVGAAALAGVVILTFFATPVEGVGCLVTAIPTIALTRIVCAKAGGGDS